jgi:Rrf2 family nitric oxide-sensitive transcriptional repressor
VAAEEAGVKLTAYTDYSLRMLIYLAANPERRPTIAEIADCYGISKNHLTKVAHNLGLAGYVTTARGRGGGLVLARPPAEIGLGAVVRSTEPDMAIVPCFTEMGQGCLIAPACRLKGALGKAQAAFLAVLDQYSLAELAANPGPLKLLFGTAATAA